MGGILNILGRIFIICFLLGAVDVRGEEGVFVYVSILPQKYFIEKIGGDLVHVSVMALPGASPAVYEPKPDQMKALSKADIYYTIGVPFEGAWLKKIAASNRRMLIVHTEEGIEKRLLEVHHENGEDSEEPEHREEGRRDHALKDPHIWLSPPLVMLQARTILKALQEADPVNRSAYEANYSGFMFELIDLDAEIRDIFWGMKNRTPFMVFHPSWGYFADAYGLKQIPIEVEGKQPKPAELKALVQLARKEGIKVIFAQPQFSAKSARIVAEAIDGQVLFADPLAEDWENNLRRQALTFRSVIGKSP